MSHLEKLITALKNCDKELSIARIHLLELKRRERKMKWRKRFTIIWNFLIALALLFFILADRGHAYTYDGIIDPKTVQQEKCIPVGMDRGAVVFACDEDGFQSILWVYKNMIVQFAYKLGEEVYILRLNKQSHYEQIKPEVKDEKSTERKI